MPDAGGASVRQRSARLTDSRPGRVFRNDTDAFAAMKSIGIPELSLNGRTTRRLAGEGMPSVFSPL